MILLPQSCPSQWEAALISVMQGKHDTTSLVIPKHEKLQTFDPKHGKLCHLLKFGQFLMNDQIATGSRSVRRNCQS